MPSPPPIYPLMFRALARRKNGPEPVPALAGAAQATVLIEESEQFTTAVANGPLAGMPLSELPARWPAAFGKHRPEPEAVFGLNIRVLEITRDTPLLVHPAGAGANLENTEFWHCLEAAGGGTIATGLSVRATRDQFLQRLHSPRLRELLQVFPARPGDAYLFPPGRLHGATAGVRLLQIRRFPHEARVVTDFAPPPENAPGFPGEINAVRFEERRFGRISGEAWRPPHTRRIPLVPHCPAFTVDEFRLADRAIGRTRSGSFHVFVPLKGRLRLENPHGRLELAPLEAGALPPGAGEYRLIAAQPGTDLLRIIVPGA